MICEQRTAPCVHLYQVEPRTLMCDERLPVPLALLFSSRENKFFCKGQHRQRRTLHARVLGLVAEQSAHPQAPHQYVAFGVDAVAGDALAPHIGFLPPGCCGTTCRYLTTATSFPSAACNLRGANIGQGRCGAYGGGCTCRGPRSHAPQTAKRGVRGLAGARTHAHLGQRGLPRSV